MSDDPKCVAGCVPFYGGEKRHHKDCPYYPESLTKLNADRIEELEAELHLLKTSCIDEVAVRNPNVMEYMRHWEGRAEAAEAKLAKAEWLLVDATVQLEEGKIKTRRNRAALIRQFLAELTGDKE